MIIAPGQAGAGQIYPTAATWNFSLGGRVLDDKAVANLAPYDASQIVLFSIVADPSLSYAELDPLLRDSPLDITLHPVKSTRTEENQGYIRIKGIAWSDSANSAGALLDDVEDEIGALWRNVEWYFEGAQQGNLTRAEDGSLVVSDRWATLFGSKSAVQRGRAALVDLWKSTSQKYRDAEAWLADRADDLDAMRDETLAKVSEPFKDAYGFAAEEFKSFAFLLFLALLVGIVVWKKA